MFAAILPTVPNFVRSRNNRLFSISNRTSSGKESSVIGVVQVAFFTFALTVSSFPAFFPELTFLFIFVT